VLRRSTIPQLVLAAAAAALAASTAAVAQEPPARPEPAVRRASAPPPAPATAALAGLVVDAWGEPVAFAQVNLLDGRVGTIADDSGRFLVDSLPAGPTEFGVRRIGYEPLAFRIELLDSSTVHVRVRLTQVVARLSAVNVQDARIPGLLHFGFYERREGGHGTFFLPADLEHIRPSRTSDIVRGVSGIFVDTRSSTETALFGRFAGQVCPIAVYIDGYFTPGSPDETLRPDSVLAVEIYGHAATTPVRFQRTGACGAVVIWTTWIRWIERDRLERAARADTALRRPHDGANP
jgi:hypothetical protein